MKNMVSVACASSGHCHLTHSCLRSLSGRTASFSDTGLNNVRQRYAHHQNSSRFSRRPRRTGVPVAQIYRCSAKLNTSSHRCCFWASFVPSAGWQRSAQIGRALAPERQLWSYLKRPGTERRPSWQGVLAEKTALNSSWNWFSPCPSRMQTITGPGALASVGWGLST